MTYPAPGTAELDTAAKAAESYAETSPSTPRPPPRSPERYAASIPAGVNTTPAATVRRRRAGLTWDWRRTGLQFVAALAAVIVGCGFGYVVAGDDHGLQIFLSATVAVGLFFVFSAFATQLYRKFNRTRRS